MHGYFIKHDVCSIPQKYSNYNFNDSYNPFSQDFLRLHTYLKYTSLCLRPRANTIVDEFFILCFELLIIQFYYVRVINVLTSIN